MFLAATDLLQALQTRLAGLGSSAPYDPNRPDPRRLPRGARLACERDPAAGAIRHSHQEWRGGSQRQGGDARHCDHGLDHSRPHRSRRPLSGGRELGGARRSSRKGRRCRSDGERISDRRARRADWPGLARRRYLGPAKSLHPAGPGECGELRRRPLHAPQDHAAERAILRARRQDRAVQPARRELRQLDDRRLGLRSRDGPDLQVDPLLHRQRRRGRRLRLVPRQHAGAAAFDFGHRDENTLEISARWRADRLLHHRRPDRRRCRPPLHRTDRQGAAAAALGAWLPAVALQLHE